MSLINEYESLKLAGTTYQDRLKYILSLSNKNEIEKYLKDSLFSSYDDLQMFISVCLSTKNDKNLLEIFKTDSLPIKQRILAGQYWIKFQKDEQKIHDFLIESINNKNLPRYFKKKLLKNLHRINYLIKSNSFFYDLICHLTKTNNHNQYNIDAHLVQFCKKDQIVDLLSQWSIKRLEQIDCSSSFYSKLIRYQPIIVIDLIRGDLNENKKDNEKFSNYF
ncbi:unnamed protein product, partial [Rotaria sp. Silwood2]